MQRVAVFSVPRSGSTWLGELLNSSPAVKYCYQPLFSYATKDYLDENSDLDRIIEFFERLARSEDSFQLQTEQRKSGILPDFEKAAEITHIVFKEVRYINLVPHLLATDPGLHLILLVRNPVDVMSSWFRAPREFHPDWSKEEEWYAAAKKNQGRPEEYFGFGRWLEATECFVRMARDHPGRVLLQRYEDLMGDTDAAARRVFDHVGLPMTSQTAAFIGESRSTTVNDTYSVYRKKTDRTASRGIVDPEIAGRIAALAADRGLDRFLQD